MQKVLYLLIVFSFAVLHANEVPQLSLQGQAVLYKPADEISLNIGVTTLGKEAEKVLQENSQKMNALLHELEKSGLEKSEIHTGQFTIRPTFTPYPKNPPPDWQPAINGYEVTNIIQIKTEKIKQVGTFIDIANKADANKINDLQPGLKDERKYREEAITQATQNAIADAEVMAKAANVKLVRLLSISLNEAKNHFPQPLTAQFFKARNAEAESTPIESGEIEVKANVSVIFEIEKI